MDIPTIGWTEKHLEDLERMFPEPSYDGDTNKLLVRTGQREVIQYIRNMIKRGERRVHD